MAREALGALAAAGYDVTVVAGRPSYEPEERYRWRPLTRRRDGSVSVERVGSFAFSRMSMLGRVANYLSYLFLVGLRVPAVRADLIMAMTDPPVAVVIAAIAARLRRLPLIYNVRDLHPEMAVAAGMIQPGAIVWCWKRLHRWAVRRAAGVIVLGEDMRRRVLAYGLPASRVRVVRDGAELPTRPLPHNNPVSLEVRCGFPFVVMHAGNLGFAGGWDTLVEAARRLAGEPVGFVFVGAGAAAEHVRRKAAALPNVRFLPARPRGEVPNLLASADLHIVTLKHGLEGLVVPSKLYPVLGAGRPVLAVVPNGSDVASIVRQAHCGWVSDPDDPAAVTAAVRAAMLDRGRLEEMGRRAREAAQEYGRARVLDEFVRAVSDLAGLPS